MLTSTEEKDYYYSQPVGKKLKLCQLELRYGLTLLSLRAGQKERRGREGGMRRGRERTVRGGGDHILWESINAATNGCFEKGIQRAKNEESDFVPEEEELRKFVSHDVTVFIQRKHGD